MSFYGSPVDKREKVSVEHVIRYIFCYPPPQKKITFYQKTHIGFTNYMVIDYNVWYQVYEESQNKQEKLAFSFT